MNLIKFADLAEKSVLPLRKLLAQKTPEDCAKLFKKAGILAFIADEKRCPIAKYLKHYGIKARVNSDSIDFGSGPYSHMYINFTRPLQQFVSRFDKGKYPNLVNPASLKKFQKELEAQKKHRAAMRAKLKEMQKN